AQAILDRSWVHLIEHLDEICLDPVGRRCIEVKYPVSGTGSVHELLEFSSRTILYELQAEGSSCLAIEVEHAIEVIVIAGALQQLFFLGQRAHVDSQNAVRMGSHDRTPFTAPVSRQS